MSRSEKSNYQTLADFARLVGVDRTTVLAWVRSGRIKSRKPKTAPKNQHHRLNEALFYNTKKLAEFAKPYPKYSTTWSKTELYVLHNWTGTDEGLAKAVGRSVNAVRIRRCMENARKRAISTGSKITDVPAKNRKGNRNHHGCSADIH